MRSRKEAQEGRRVKLSAQGAALKANALRFNAKTMVFAVSLSLPYRMPDVNR
jgi:hypothetical protein